MNKLPIFGIHFGALCDPVRAQLRAQSVDFTHARYAPIFQASVDAITKLAIDGFLTESEVRRARQRFMKKLKKHITRIDK